MNQEAYHSYRDGVTICNNQQQYKERYNYQKQKNSSKPKHLFIRADYTLIKINLDDILFIEGLDDYLKIHLLNQKPVTARMTLKSMMEKLSPENFMRVHRSYIVAFSRIESVRGKIIFIGEEEIPIGSSYEEGFLKHFNK